MQILMQLIFIDNIDLFFLLCLFFVLTNQEISDYIWLTKRDGSTRNVVSLWAKIYLKQSGTKGSLEGRKHIISSYLDRRRVSGALAHRRELRYYWCCKSAMIYANFRFDIYYIQYFCCFATSHFTGNGYRIRNFKRNETPFILIIIVS